MWNHQGRSAYRRNNRNSLLAKVERLEPRCVLNGGPIAPMYGIAAPSDGKIDSGPSADIGGRHDFADGPSHSSNGPTKQFDGPSVGATQPPKVINESIPLNEVSEAFQLFDAGTYLAVGSNYTETVIVMSLSNDADLRAVTTYAVPPPSNDGSVSEPAHGDPKGGVEGASHPVTGPIVSSNVVPVQATESASHAIPQVGADFSINVAMTAQSSAAKMPIVAVTNQAATTTIPSGGFSYNSGIVQQVVPAIVDEVPVVGNLFAAGLNATANIQQLVANHKAGLVTLAHATDASDWPVQKASLVGMPLNIKGVEQALEKVMGELGHLGTALSSWLDARHLTGAAAVFTVVTVGGGTAIYLRRRSSKQGQKRDDEEASSSWLFARLQSAPDAS
jgi:hypothetical protein